MHLQCGDPWSVIAACRMHKHWSISMLHNRIYLFIILSFWWQLRSHIVVVAAAYSNVHIDYDLIQPDTPQKWKRCNNATQTHSPHHNNNNSIDKREKNNVERLVVLFIYVIFGSSLSSFVNARNWSKRLIICDKDGYYNIMWLDSADLYAKRFADDLSKCWIYFIYIYVSLFVCPIGLPDSMSNHMVQWMDCNCDKLFMSPEQYDEMVWGFRRPCNLCSCHFSVILKPDI